jgi:hypothetical protein
MSDQTPTIPTFKLVLGALFSQLLPHLHSESNPLFLPSMFHLFSLFLQSFVCPCSRRWWYRQNNFCQGEYRSKSILLTRSRADHPISKRHLTGEFEKKYIGTAYPFNHVYFWTWLSFNLV